MVSLSFCSALSSRRPASFDLDAVPPTARISDPAGAGAPALGRPVHEAGTSPEGNHGGPTHDQDSGGAG